jgi:hypothetical protein
MLAITRERVPQIGQPGICAVLVDKTRENDAALSLAAMAFDFEQIQLAERDRPRLLTVRL